VVGDQKVKHDSAQRAKVRDRTRCEPPLSTLIQEVSEYKAIHHFSHDAHTRMNTHIGAESSSEKQPVFFLILLQTVIPKKIDHHRNLLLQRMPHPRSLGPPELVDLCLPDAIVGMPKLGETNGSTPLAGDDWC
jgi:hypothetical protein